MESWVDIKKENLIMRVPYQAFKDRFEHDGFSLVDENLNADPTFSVSKPVENAVVDNEISQQQENKDVVIEPQDKTNKVDETSNKKGGLNNGNKSKTSNKKQHRA